MNMRKIVSVQMAALNNYTQSYLSRFPQPVDVCRQSLQFQARGFIKSNRDLNRSRPG